MSGRREAGAVPIPGRLGSNDYPGVHVALHL